MPPQELIKIRETLNLTKSQFAMLLNITPMLYGRYESGRSAIPEKIEKAAKALSMTSGAQSKTSASAPTVEKKAAQKTVDAMKDAMKDAAEKTARKTVKKTARKVTEKVVDELVDRAKQSRSVEEKMPTPTTPAASIPEAIEKEGKPEAAEKPATPKKSRKKPADKTTTSAKSPVEKKPAKSTVEEKKTETTKKPRGRKKAATPAVENVMPVPAVENVMPVPAVENVMPVPAVENVMPATPDPEEKKPQKLRGKNPSKQPVVLIESQSGSQITTSDILKKIPAGCESVYIKPEENKAYWVNGDDSGSVDLW